jgi:hypothetical protein
MRNKASLAKIQKDFSDHIFASQKKAILAQLPYEKEEALERLQIYRNNVVGNFNSVLESTFEVVKKLVGEKYFYELSEKYAKKHPSLSGNLDDYGEFFPLFLKRNLAANKLPYLHEIANLEWLLHRCYFASNSAEFDVKEFQKLAPEKFFNLTFELHPSCVLLKSNFPIFTIYQNSARKKNTVKSGEFVLVEKADGRPKINNLTAEEFIFLSEIAAGKNLYKIYQKICRVAKKGACKEFDVGQMLQKFINSRVISGFKAN